MGCDIHVYVEYNQFKPGRPAYWNNFGGCINPGRDYDIFAKLAGVRSENQPLVPVRGIPDDTGHVCTSDYWIYINDSVKEDEYSCSQTTAASWHANGRKYKQNALGSDRWIEHPDWHSASWLTVGEFREATQTGDIEYAALVAAAQTLQRGGNEVRIVFWFDN